MRWTTWHILYAISQKQKSEMFRIYFIQGYVYFWCSLRSNQSKALLHWVISSFTSIVNDASFGNNGCVTTLISIVQDTSLVNQSKTLHKRRFPDSATKLLPSSLSIAKACYRLHPCPAKTCLTGAVCLGVRQAMACQKYRRTLPFSKFHLVTGTYSSGPFQERTLNSNLRLEFVQNILTLRASPSNLEILTCTGKVSLQPYEGLDWSLGMLRQYSRTALLIYRLPLQSRDRQEHRWTNAANPCVTSQRK